jgi:hypothetical protein
LRTDWFVDIPPRPKPPTELSVVTCGSHAPIPHCAAIVAVTFGGACVRSISLSGSCCAPAFAPGFAPLFGARVCVRGGPRGSRKPPCPAISWILLCDSWRKVLRRFSMGALVYVESPQLTYTALTANVLDPVGPQRSSCYVLSLVMSAVTCGPCSSPFDCCSLFVILGMFAYSLV